MILANVHAIIDGEIICRRKIPPKNFDRRITPVIYDLCTHRLVLRACTQSVHSKRTPLERIRAKTALVDAQLEPTGKKFSSKSIAQRIIQLIKL
jgi:hypothetical protein